jgi:hypothetical protein
VINKIEFSAKYLTSNAGLFLLMEHTSKNGIFDLIDHDLVFENTSTSKIKMNHIKTFRLKYVFLAGKIIRTARSVAMKLSEKYPYQEIYAKAFPEKTSFLCPNLLFPFKLGQEKSFLMSEFVKRIIKMMQNRRNYANVEWVPPQSSPFRGENVGKFYRNLAVKPPASAVGI